FPAATGVRAPDDRARDHGDDVLALRSARGLAGARRPVRGGADVVPDRQLFLSATADSESTGGDRARVSDRRSAATVRAEFSAFVPCRWIPWRARRAAHRADVRPAFAESGQL